MKKTLTWIILVWSVLSIPYALVEAVDFYEFFGTLLYVGLIIYLMISELKEKKREEEKLKRLEKWVENYLPDFWKTRGKQFQYGWNYLKNDILIAIKELLNEC